MFKWLVYFTACLTTVVHMALLNNIGTIFVDVMETFNATRAETAVIHSTAFGVGPGLAILSGLLIPKLGLTKCSVLFSILASVGIIFCFVATKIWHMVLSFGILFGVGLINLYICSTVAISQQFTGRKQQLMLSLQSAFVGLSSMAYPYILTYLSSIYGFRGALLIIGGISMNCIPCCLFWKQSTVYSKKHDQGDRITNHQTEQEVIVVEEGDTIVIQKKKPEHNTKEHDTYYIRTFPVLPNQRNTKRVTICERQLDTLHRQHETNWNHTLITSLKSVLSNRYFVFFWTGTTITFTVVLLPFIFIADIFDHKGFSHDDVVFGYLLLNILNIIARISTGVILQIQCVSVFFCPLLSTIITMSAMIGIAIASSRLVLILFFALVGIPSGSIQAMLIVGCTSLVGVKDFPTAAGLLYTTCGITNAVTGPVVGYMRDVTGSYEIPIFVAVGITGVSAVLFMVAFIQQSVESFKTRKRSSVFYLTSF